MGIVRFALRRFCHDRSFAMTWAAVLLVGIALGYVAGKLTRDIGVRWRAQNFDIASL
jgi:hypothetical protein